MTISRINATRVSCDDAGVDERGCPSQILVDGAAVPEQARLPATERGWASGEAGDRCPRHRSGGAS